MKATRLELKIDLGPSVVGQPSIQGSHASKHKSPYVIRNTKPRAKTTGALTRESNFTAMAKNSKSKAKEDERGERDRRKTRIPKTAEDLPKPIIRNKDTPPNKSRVMIKEETSPNKMSPSHNATAIPIPTPLRGDVDSPLKPYKFRSGALRSSMLRLTTPGTAQFPSRTETQKVIDGQAGMKALKELFGAIGMGTRMLEFKDMLEVKVAVGMGAHISRLALEDLNTFEKVIEELSMLWKINRMDLDLLEHLLTKIGMLERFTPDLDKYKNMVGYSELAASTEREVTTIIGSLHNLLQDSEESSGTYTTICFLHYGDVYSFNREKLFCMKNDLSHLLAIHPTQIIYFAKVSANNNGYVTAFQMPCSISKKLVVFAKKNHDILMSLGMKGIQVTGSDGLRYTQSMGYLQDKIPIATQTNGEETRKRSGKTSSARSSLPPLRQKSQQSKSRVEKTSQSKRDETYSSLTNERYPPIHTPARTRESPTTPVDLDPGEAKFERRIRLVKSTLTELSKHESDELVQVLLEQIHSLHRNIVSLKKDLKEKTRDLNASQGFVQKAEKEMKTLEMRVETKAQQISETNSHLIKKIKKLLNENLKLKTTIERMEAELDIHRQVERENRMGSMIKVARVNRMNTATV
ncbi:uncharacterized protein LOC104265504 isoform X2 [Ciona intestinalis]